MSSGILEMVQSVVDAELERQKLADLHHGTVLSLSPLVIQTEGGMDVAAPHLTLSCLCKPFVTTVFAHSHDTPEGPTDVQLESVVVWRGLQAGDRVRMLRHGGGQHYFLMDREEAFP